MDNDQNAACWQLCYEILQHSPYMDENNYISNWRYAFNVCILGSTVGSHSRFSIVFGNHVLREGTRSYDILCPQLAFQDVSVSRSSLRDLFEAFYEATEAITFCPALSRKQGTWCTLCLSAPQPAMQKRCHAEDLLCSLCHFCLQWWDRICGITAQMEIVHTDSRGRPKVLYIAHLSQMLWGWTFQQWNLLGKLLRLLQLTYKLGFHFFGG